MGWIKTNITTIIKYFVLFIVTPAVLILVFNIVFYFLVPFRTIIDNTHIDTYQYRQLTITYMSACVTTLALVVALLKEEIRSLWSSSKLIVKAKTEEILIEHVVQTPAVQAEYYSVIHDYTTCELCEGSGEAIAFDDED